MGGGPAAGRCTRGGESIQAQRAAGLTALLVLAGLGGYAAAKAGTLAPVAGAIALAGLALVALALVGWIELAGWGVALVGCAYAVVDLARSLPLAVAPVYGAGLLLAAEGVYASRELATVPEEHPWRRLPWLAGVAVCALGAGFVPVAAAGASVLPGVGGELVALVSASVLLAIPAALARRKPQDEPTTSG